MVRMLRGATEIRRPEGQNSRGTKSRTRRSVGWKVLGLKSRTVVVFLAPWSGTRIRPNLAVEEIVA